MNYFSKLPPDNITALSQASNRVSQAVAEFKADVKLEGDMRALPWDQAFALAVVGSAVREVPGSTYTTSKFIFDSAQRISFAWYFEPESIDRALEALVGKGLVGWRANGLQVDLTPKAERMLLAAGKALGVGDAF
ncbi:hypothetical protein LP414_09245 [Polaromonas sp. P1(28)-13]|nr:hypothetical protein LP414_09245 [Polaromonas sp. P1(28)-13]